MLCQASGNMTSRNYLPKNKSKRLVGFLEPGIIEKENKTWKRSQYETRFW